MSPAIWWLASYPKSGNTWVRAWLRNMQLDGAAPARIDDLALGPAASSRDWFDEVLGLDSSELGPERIQQLRPDLYRWASAHAEAPLYCKAHDIQARLDGNAWLFPPDASRGALYLVRNPLDVAVSLAPHMGVDLDEAIDRIVSPGHAIAARRNGADDQLRQHLSDWSSHVLAWVDQRAMPVRAIRYEDLHCQPLAAFGQVAAFLGLDADPEAVQRAIRHSAFPVLQAQEAQSGFPEASHKAARFFRRGEPDGWRDVLTPAQVDRVVAAHRVVMARFGYLDARGRPVPAATRASPHKHAGSQA